MVWTVREEFNVGEREVKAFISVKDETKERISPLVTEDYQISLREPFETVQISLSHVELSMRSWVHESGFEIIF